MNTAPTLTALTTTASKKDKEVETSGVAPSPASLPVKAGTDETKGAKLFDKVIERLTIGAMIYASVVLVGHVIVAIWRAL